MPHLLIAGRTGTGKSVCLNAMILSILMTKRPDEVKMILIDPKKVELSQYKRIPHLMHPVVTDMKKAESILAWACDKMDERYELPRAAPRSGTSRRYNQLGARRSTPGCAPRTTRSGSAFPTYMPYIVIIADEMADLMMTAAKEVEQHIVRLAQLARAVGMHLILATQKPAVDVITGLIKGNLPARIAFQVTSRSDSRVVLDEMGADRLLGNGDMLFLIPGTSHIIRAQGTFVSDAEVNRVCQYLERYPVEFSRELIQLQVSGGAGGKDRGAGAEGARRAVRAGHRDRHPRGPRLVLAARSGPWASATAAPPGSSTSWPRTASSASSRAARPARCSTPGRNGKPSRTAAGCRPRRRRE